MCEIPKIPKIYDYNRDKMGITQNEVVWNQNTGGEISLCSEFLYAVNFLHPVQSPSLQFLLTFLHPGLMKSPRFLNIQYQYEAMMTEVPKTCKTIKNNLETKSVALNGPAHVNWLNSYD